MNGSVLQAFIVVNAAKIWGLGACTAVAQRVMHTCGEWPAQHHWGCLFSDELAQLIGGLQGGWLHGFNYVPIGPRRVLTSI